MGIETSSADVEESTEPPLRPPATAAKGTSRLVRDHQSVAASYSSEDQIKIIKKNPIAPTESLEQVTEKGTPTPTRTDPDPSNWGEEYKYAHTFSISQISNVLAVNIQYVTVYLLTQVPLLDLPSY